MKRHRVMKLDRTTQIVKTGTSEKGFQYILFGTLDKEPDREIQVILSPEEARDLFSKYKALEG